MKMYTRLYSLAVVSVLLLSCGTDGVPQPWEVKYQGALKNIMHKGDLSAKANILDLQSMPHVYALGAVENLKGEVLILDGMPMISSENDGELDISRSFDHRATLLVYASVEQWNEVPVNQPLNSYEDLEEFVGQMAEQSGIDVDQPFPFMIKGMVSKLNWHVINWPEGDTEHSHEKHITSGLHGSFADREVEILGFYSNSHHAIFTHHTTNMHMHVLTNDGQIAGHIDDMIPGSEMQLLVPVVKN
ncbi:MAG: acetolactate decarboxylase [Flavobacteriales bacterium]|nr:acetolactate decarboxylase [Flavobacteriales bacterium]